MRSALRRAENSHRCPKRGRWRAALGLLVGIALPGSPPASGQLRPGEVPLEDVLEIVQLKHSLLAIDAEAGGQKRIDLELGEKVVLLRSRGRVGFVATDRRMLAVGTASAAWRQERYQIGEQGPPRVALGDRVALLVTNLRVLGFNNRDSHFTEYRIGPNEQFLASYAGANAAVALTNRNALGLSPRFANFSSTDFQLRERIVDVSPRANLATIRTDRRLLIYRAPSGTWVERRLELGDAP